MYFCGGYFHVSEVFCDRVGIEPLILVAMMIGAEIFKPCWARRGLRMALKWHIYSKNPKVYCVV